MHTRRLHAGLLRGLAIATLVVGVAFLQVRTGSSSAQASFRGYVPTNSKLQVSSIRLAAQKLLVTQAKQTASERKAIAASRFSVHGGSATYPADCPAYAAFNAPGGANSWNKQGCDMLQSEESIAFDPHDNRLIGGVNDFSGFFGFNADNPFSLTGYSVSGSGAGGSFLNWGDMPGILDPSCTDGSVLESFGDPYTAVSNSTGTAYLTSLALPNNTSSACAFTNGDNGILLNVGNANLYASGACTDHELSSNCWTPHLVHQAAVSGCPTFTAPCQFDDKESVTVDNTSSSPGFNNVYVAFDIIDNALGTEVGVVIGCNAAVTSCSAPVVYSGASNNEFSPFVNVYHDGSLGITFDDFATTDGTVHMNLTHCTVSGVTPTCGTPNTFDKVPNAVVCTTTCDASGDQFVQGLATNLYRILTQNKSAIDDRTSGTGAGHTYATWEQCAVNENYLGFLCAASNVVVDDIATPSSPGVRVSYPGARYDDTMPTIAVDQSSGDVYLAYYSTKTDLVTNGSTPSGADTGVHSGIRPFLTRSTGGTGAFAAPEGITTANDSPLADQCAELGCAPQFGDYFQVVASGGAAYIHFNVNFEQKAGPKSFWEVNGLVNQEDNYVCRFLTFPAANPTRPCS